MDSTSLSGIGVEIDVLHGRILSLHGSVQRLSRRTRRGCQAFAVHYCAMTRNYRLKRRAERVAETRRSHRRGNGRAPHERRPGANHDLGDRRVGQASAAHRLRALPGDHASCSAPAPTHWRDCIRSPTARWRASPSPGSASAGAGQPSTPGTSTSSTTSRSSSGTRRCTSSPRISSRDESAECSRAARPPRRSLATAQAVRAAIGHALEFETWRSLDATAAAHAQAGGGRDARASSTASSLRGDGHRRGAPADRLRHRGQARLHGRRPPARESSSSRASSRSHAGRTRRCIAAGRGRSASTRATARPRRRTHASATSSSAVRPGCRSRSTCRRSSATTPTTRSPRARSVARASRSTRSQTWRCCSTASRSTASPRR